MHTNWNLRPELASVCRFVAARRAGSRILSGPTSPRPDRPVDGILAELAAIRGLG